jgi:hypothetical protein
MSLLAERLRRLRWMAVPIAAYLAITVVLPAANGAALRGDFARHTGWVVAGCVAAVAAVLLAGLAATGVARAARAARLAWSSRRLTAARPERPAAMNNLRSCRVPSAGGPP